VLRRERSDGEIHNVGDVAYDVLRQALSRVPQSPSDAYVYATLHRAELVDDAALLRGAIAALETLPWPVVFAAHPRTVAALERAGCRPGARVRLREPLGYLESLSVLRGARAVVTDSGGIQREAYWLGVPCVTLRSETEWVETVEGGANRLVPPGEATRLRTVVEQAIAKREWDRTAYGDGTAAVRVAAEMAKWPHSEPSNAR
jgi:UDP-N-acetylglucosamine 2-epimerase